MQAIIGGNIRYPNLQSIADSFRNGINDTANGGAVMPNTNPDLLVFLNDALSDLYVDLRNVGDPQLLIDNYLLLGIPALTQPDPSIQVAISDAGYYNGYSWNASLALPFSLRKLLALWERVSGSNGDFILMHYCQNGLPGTQQGDLNRMYELRQNAIWMPGALQSVDIRIRGTIDMPDFQSTSASVLNFSTAYVPILGCRNAVVAKMLKFYAARFAPDLYQLASEREQFELNKLTLETVRAMQRSEVSRAAFGDEAFTSLPQYWPI